MTKPNQTLTERLDAGTVLVAEGYIFELERRGFLKAGPFVPEAVLTYPEAVQGLHREFVRAGTDVVVACTYYAHRSKLQSIGIENALEQLNVKAVELAVQAARETGALVAGNICNTWEYDPSDLKASEEKVRPIFREQVQWAKAGGADFIIAETFSHYGEALLSLEEIKRVGLPAVVTFSPVAQDHLRRAFFSRGVQTVGRQWCRCGGAQLRSGTENHAPDPPADPRGGERPRGRPAGTLPHP